MIYNGSMVVLKLHKNENLYIPLMLHSVQE